jgi:acyl carrier protein
MQRDQVEVQLREIIARHARVPVQSLAEDEALVGEAGFDSLALVMTLAELEETFRIRFPVEKVEDPACLTFRQLAGLVFDEVRRT